MSSCGLTRRPPRSCEGHGLGVCRRHLGSKVDVDPIQQGRSEYRSEYSFQYHTLRDQADDETDGAEIHAPIDNPVLPVGHHRGHREHGKDHVGHDQHEGGVVECQQKGSDFCKNASSPAVSPAATNLLTTIAVSTTAPPTRSSRCEASGPPCFHSSGPEKARPAISTGK